jgi:hypothetical protein
MVDRSHNAKKGSEMTDRLDQVQPYLFPVAESDGAESTLWGAHHRDRTVSSGLFVCPIEGIERAYWTHRVRNWFHVLSIPVVPGAIVGEYVECFACGRSYDPRIIRARHPALGNLK